jgi:hypothetical protein
MSDAQFSADFYKKIPHKPYCTDDLGYSFINPKQIAIKKRYLQHNPPCKVVYLVFDLDRNDGVMAWFDAGLPKPTWTSQNPENGHAHIGYELKAPVSTTTASKQKIIDYLAVIEAAMARKMGADSGYSGLLTKNPCHTYWRTTIWTREAYELNYLADFVDLKPLTQKEQGTGLGRNCTLFDIARKWAYKAIREYRGSTFDSWLAEVLKECLNVNSAFLEPLPYSEIKATARSIAKYCWKKDAYCYQEFIDRQTRKGQLGGLKGGAVRSASYDIKREQALFLKEQGLNNTEIANRIKVSRRTIINWLKEKD